MDKAFWIDYYNEIGIGQEPSPFAEFVVSDHINKGTLLELGCGNGRDSLFFASKGIEVTGVDQCSNVVSRLNDLGSPNSKFVTGDFTNLDFTNYFDSIYSRFTLHSVDELSARRTINWSFEHLNANGLFAIEVRSVKDELYGQGTQVDRDTWRTDHSRRFVRKNEIEDDIRSAGFEIVLSLESQGLAVYGDKDPVVIRILATRS